MIERFRWNDHPLPAEDIARRLRQVDDHILLPESLKAENLRYLLDQVDRQSVGQPSQEGAKVLRPSFAHWKQWSAAAAVVVVVAAAYLGSGGMQNSSLIAPKEAADSALSVAGFSQEEAAAAEDGLSPSVYATAGGDGGTSQQYDTSFQALADAVADQATQAQEESLQSAVGTQTTIAPRSASSSRSQGGEGDLVQVEDGLIAYYQPANYQREENTIYLVDSATLDPISTIQLESNNGVELYLTGDYLAVVIQEAQPAETILYDEVAYTPLAQLDAGSLGGDRPASFSNQGATTLVTYSLANREKPQEVSRITQDGSYFASHLEGETLYLVTSKRAYTTSLEEDTPVCNAVPIVRDAQGRTIPVGPQDISLASWSGGEYYTVISAVELEDGSRDTQAVLGSAQYLYGDGNSVYLFCDSSSDDTSQAGVVKFSYEDGQLYLEEEGELPVSAQQIAAVAQQGEYLLVAANFTDYRTGATTGVILSLDQELNQAGRLEATQRVTIQAAVLQGAEGTAVLSDATLLQVDCTDPSSLVERSTVSLSSSPQVLASFGENRLLALGRNLENDEEAGLRLTLLDGDSGRELAVCTLPGNASTTGAMEDPALLLVLPEEGLAAMPLIIKERTGSSDPKLLSWGYGVFTVQDESISLKGTIAHGETLDEEEILNQFLSVERGAVDGKRLYTFSGSKILSSDLDTLEKQEEMALF